MVLAQPRRDPIAGSPRRTYHVTMEPADAELSEGRALTRTNLWRIFWVSLVVGMMSASILGAAAWLRVLMIGLVCLLVHRGRRWALWLLGLLTVFAGVGMVVVAVVRAELHWTDRMMFGVLGAAQVLSYVILAKAPEVRRFMDHQRTRLAAGA
jgi:hypothetical protein